MSYSLHNRVIVDRSRTNRSFPLDAYTLKLKRRMMKTILLNSVPSDDLAMCDQTNKVSLRVPDAPSNHGSVGKCSPDAEQRQKDLPPGMQELEGFRRYPCRARGMSDCHTTRTAYFDVPNDAPHGLQLVCSHHICSQSGRVFRFCTVCSLPCAKRNFSKRHHHNLLICSPATNPYEDTDLAETIMMKDGSDDNSGCPPTKKMRSVPLRSSANEITLLPKASPVSVQNVPPQTSSNNQTKDGIGNRPKSTDVLAISQWLKSNGSVPNVMQMLQQVRQMEFEAAVEFGNLDWSEEDFDNLFAEEA